MIRRPPTWLWSLLGLVLFWLSCPATAQSPSAFWADEFCGTSESQLTCPRTTREGCLCSLTARSSGSVGETWTALEPVVTLRLPPFRPAVQRVLNEPTIVLRAEEFYPSVPTHPPRRIPS